MMKRNFAVLAILALSSGVAYILYFGSNSGATTQGGWTPPPMPVAALKIEPLVLPQTLSGIGIIEANRQVDIASEVAGRIESIHFQSGQKVMKGDPLVQLNDESDQAELRRLKAKLNLASKQYKRVTKLKGLAVSDSRIDEARSTLDEVRAQIANVQTSLDKKEITAPFDGVLGIRKVNLGQYLNAGDTIVNTTDLSRFNVTFKLPEKALSHIAIGQMVQVKVDALENEKFMARISTIEPQIEPGLHTVIVQAEVLNSTQSLRPGLFAQAQVNLGQDQEVIMVPETALERSTFGNTLYIVKKQAEGPAIAEQKVVEIGRRQDGKVVITNGLEVGQSVITSGQNRLFFGAPVVIKDPKNTVKLAGDTPSANNQQ
ncbi:MAG: efflux RND transporter periplasmic adaptor subunit [Rhodospirillales bacterium]|nr:efflux RND transporter periplasmic adaptor subunit [Rhodospirillales bacterium]